MAKKKRSKKESGQNIIVNMGLFWDRDKVCWAQKQGTGPKGLNGIQEDARTKGEVNFWQQQGVYALYDANYHLVYMGQSVKSSQGDSGIGDRLKKHLSDSLAGRWEKFSWFGFRKVLRDRTLAQPRTKKRINRMNLANALEGIVIAVAEPSMNGQDGRFGKKVKRYIQNQKDNVGPQKKIEDDLKMLKEDMGKILNTIKKNENFCKKFVSKKMKVKG